MLLEKLEYEVDRGKEDFATTSAATLSSRHRDVSVGVCELERLVVVVCFARCLPAGRIGLQLGELWLPCSLGYSRGLDCGIPDLRRRFVFNVLGIRLEIFRVDFRVCATSGLALGGAVHL